MLNQVRSVLFSLVQVRSG